VFSENAGPLTTAHCGHHAVDHQQIDWLAVPLDSCDRPLIHPFPSITVYSAFSGTSHAGWQTAFACSTSRKVSDAPSSIKGSGHWVA
jgi:hypothetical protein